MATVVTNTPSQEHMRPAFLDGQLKRMLINGQWVEAASGKTFDSINPSTGETLATAAEGDAEDINRAVVAARRAFEGPWSTFKPYDRQQGHSVFGGSAPFPPLAKGGEGGFA
jgi:hypothetical protein